MAHLGEAVERLRRATVSIRAGRGASGSGVVWRKDGLIVTNAHVIAAARSGPVEVEFWDGRRVASPVTSRSQRLDLAMLTVALPGGGAAAAEFATIGDSAKLRPGEMVVAVGNPLGFTGAASSGVVHSAAGSWVASQLRLAPGNSGGPLANTRGEVVGINTMMYRGLALSVPSETVTRFLAGDHAAAAGADARARLGVTVNPVRWGGGVGLLILEIEPGSAAARASLLAGDLVVGAGGRRPFSSPGDLHSAIGRACASGGGTSTLALDFVRGAERHKVRSVAVNFAGIAAGAGRAA